MAIYATKFKEDIFKDFPGARSFPIFDSENTPLHGCSAMLNIFSDDQYKTPGVHDDNEGFYVISGEGMAMIGIDEYVLTPGTAIYAPAWIPHALKKTGDEDLKVFIYHFPVTKY